MSLVSSDMEGLLSNDQHFFDSLLVGSPRLLNVFTVVKFPNSECQSSLGRNGTCYTSSQCSSLGGAAQGSCASSFGTCCVFNAGCGERTFQNSTYLTLNTTQQGSCNFQVCSTQSTVCQLRLDFESFSLTGPLEDNFTNAVDSVVKNSHSIVGQCLSDTFIGKE